VDAVESRQSAIPSFTIEDLGPVHFVLSDELLQFFSVLIQADPDYLEAPVVIFQIGFPDPRNLRSAGTTPGSPEVQEDYFPP